MPDVGTVLARMTGVTNLTRLTPAFLLLAAPATAASVAPYDHILLIVEENQEYAEIIGDTTNAPNINSYAQTYGLAYNFAARNQ